MELLDDSSLYKVLKLKASGNYVSLPYNLISGTRTDLTEKVRVWLQELNCPYVLKNESEAEDLLDAISSELSEGNLDMPNNTSYDYLVKVNSNVTLHVEAADEYSGQGEYEMNACISGLIVTPDVSSEEVEEAVQWIKKFENA
ncbi:hypothetical protein [Viridibacillus arvi]|uniref:hypothetical protein n=1 Tax=Viridibacillus arvi TaxID=263475 RepID=UPI0034D011CB